MRQICIDNVKNHNKSLNQETKKQGGDVDKGRPRQPVPRTIGRPSLADNAKETTADNGNVSEEINHSDSQPLEAGVLEIQGTPKVVFPKRSIISDSTLNSHNSSSSSQDSTATSITLCSERDANGITNDNERGYLDSLGFSTTVTTNKNSNLADELETDEREKTDADQTQSQDRFDMSELPDPSQKS